MAKRIEEKVYCIYQREWEILLAKAGIGESLGLLFQVSDSNREEVLQTLHQMVRKKMLKVENDILQITPEYAALLEVVGQAKEGYHLMERHENGWSHGFAYVGEPLAVVTCSRARKKAFEMRLVSKENWTSYLWETGMFPAYRTKERPSVIEEIQMEKKESSELMQLESVSVIIAKICLAEKREEGWLAFTEDDGAQFLVWQEEVTKKMLYTMEGFQQIWREMQETSSEKTLLLM